MSAIRSDQDAGNTYAIGTVFCRRCQGVIQINQPGEVAAEFSVRCQACGERGFFSKRQIAIETAPERRKKPRFGRR